MISDTEKYSAIVRFSEKISNGNRTLIIKENIDGSKQLIPNLTLSSENALTLEEVYACLDDKSIYIDPDLRTAIILTRSQS